VAAGQKPSFDLDERKGKDLHLPYQARSSREARKLGALPLLIWTGIRRGRIALLAPPRNEKNSNPIIKIRSPDYSPYSRKG